MSFLRSKLTPRFFLYILLAVLLIEIPVAGNYFRGLNTVIHESAHAFIALFGGHLEKITLLIDSEGITTGPRASWLEGIFASLAGYTFSSFMAFLSFWLIKKKKFALLIDILLGILFISLILWVRNLYGILWLTSFTAIFLILVINGKKKFVHHVLYLIASIILVDSIKSAYEILTMSIVMPFTAGDASNLAYLTMFIPAPVWGIFFFVQAIGFTIFSLNRNLYRLDG